EALWHLPHTAAQILAVVFVVIPLSAVTIVFGELIPKIFAIENKEWVCLRLAPIMRGFAGAIWPLANFFGSCVKQILQLVQVLSTGKSLEWGDIPGFHELQAAVSLARTKRLMGAQE